LDFAQTFLVVAQTFLTDAQTFLVVAQTFLVVAQTFLADAQTFLTAAQTIIQLSKDGSWERGVFLDIPSNWWAELGFLKLIKLNFIF